MNVLKAVTLAAATARVASLVSKDEIMAPVRDKVDEWALGAPYGSLPERVQYLINCHRCSSVWAAGAVLALNALGTPGQFLVGVLALSQAGMSTIEVLEAVTENE